MTMLEVATNATALVDIAKSMLSLLAEFPLNIIVTGMVIGITMKVIKSGKKVAQ